MLSWIKKLKRIVTRYDADLQAAHARIAELEKLIRDRTDISVELGFRSATNVIVTGRYKNADYVQTFQINERDTGALVDQLREMQRFGVIRKIDCPPPLKAVFKREVML